MPGTLQLLSADFLNKEAGHCLTAGFLKLGLSGQRCICHGRVPRSVAHCHPREKVDWEPGWGGDSIGEGKEEQMSKIQKGRKAGRSSFPEKVRNTLLQFLFEFCFENAETRLVSTEWNLDSFGRKG